MSWVGPSEAAADKAEVPDHAANTGDDAMYRALVVDSGPIIRQTGMTSLRGKARAYYTVPAVLQEIRDAKARQHLQQLPFELQEKHPSAEAVAAVVRFARQTGDYQSLSTVDVQVLALLYDLEREGCQGDIAHIRTTPKRKLGVGKIQPLSAAASRSSSASSRNGRADNNESKQETNEHTVAQADRRAADDGENRDGTSPVRDAVASTSRSFFEAALSDIPTDEPSGTTTISDASVAKPKSWAMLVNPAQASSEPPKLDTPVGPRPGVQGMSVAFGQMKLVPDDIGTSSNVRSNHGDGQFSDAEDDQDVVVDTHQPKDIKTVEDELELAFPSLSAAATVPYEGSEDERDGQSNLIGKQSTADQRAPKAEQTSQSITAREKLDKQKKESLKSISKSGKVYNSFRKYNKLMKPTPVKKKSSEPKIDEEKNNSRTDIDGDASPTTTDNDGEVKRSMQSRIIGGTAFGGQEEEVEDDGEGWVTCSADIQSMKAFGSLDPARKPGDRQHIAKEPKGPPISKRAACTTTDFAMQNVILQMNLELLSVDGIKIRRLKSWVQRCGACFKIYADDNGTGPISGKRMFCAHCGSDMMQRIAASVDAKSGRLKLHMKKNYQHNLRGTKYSLPKPGSGDRFQGDLLLREDQMMTGVWNQKVKIRSGGQARASAQSMFGRDLATSVGCNNKSMTADDIRVGFGRRNPNAAKGRERRGKKKKNSNKACGLRRY